MASFFRKFAIFERLRIAQPATITVDINPSNGMTGLTLPRGTRVQGDLRPFTSLIDPFVGTGNGIVAAASTGLRALSVLSSKTAVTGQINSGPAGSLDFPRTVQIAANSGTTGNILLEGLGPNGETITEVVTANGTSAVNTLQVFASVGFVSPLSGFTSGGQISIGPGNRVWCVFSPKASTAYQLLKKASADTAYSVVADNAVNMQGGSAVAVLTNSLLSTDTSFAVTAPWTVDGLFTTTPSNATYMVKIFSQDQRFEWVKATLSSGTFTVVARGLNGTTAQNFPKGAWVAVEQDPTIAPTIVADDRFILIGYTNEIQRGS
jgi:hypothetical protein